MASGKYIDPPLGAADRGNKKPPAAFIFERHSLGPSASPPVDETPSPLDASHADSLGPVVSPVQAAAVGIPGRRVVSLDSYGGSGTGGATLGYLGPGGYQGRSHSAASVIETKCFVPPSVMVPLNFDKVQDDKAHPLSSLRSCSEFGMHGISPDDVDTKSAPKKKSIWKRTVGWFKGKKTKAADHEGELSLAERSRLAQMGEEFRQQRIASTGTARQSRWSTQPTPRISTDSIYSSSHQSEIRRDSSAYTLRRDSTSYTPATPSGKRRVKSSPSLVKEFKSTFWGTLGMNHDPSDCNKDIEMKTFRIAGAWVLPIEGGFSPITRSSSAFSLSSRDSLTSRDRPSLFGVSAPRLPTTTVMDISVFDIVFTDLWHVLYVSESFKAFADYSLMLLDFLRDQSLRYGEEEFFDLMRIQPVSTGNYFRGMLTAGIVSTLFNGSAFVSMHLAYADEQKREEYSTLSGCIVYGWLLIVTTLNLIQLPLRISIHLQFLQIPQASVHEAGDILRDLSGSNAWIFNKLMNWLIDIVSVLGLVFAEFFIFNMRPMCDEDSTLSDCSHSNSLGNLVVSTASTVVLTLIIRTAISVMFCASAADPVTLSEARKRGLSRYDVDKLPAFLYTDREDVNNPTCSICLCAFDLGEMLICLPCDNRHSFHASCIRDWLVRQNACPLCQKLV